jgi:hypothetical protein
MPLIEKARAASSQESFYSADKYEIVGKQDCAREKMRPPLRRDDFILESVLSQRSTAKHPTGYTHGFQPVKETADMTDSASGGAHARRAGNQIGNLGLAIVDVVHGPGPLTG